MNSNLIGDVVMYGADWCGDCRRAKAYFADQDINYTYVDLEANPDEVERVLERNDGVKRIPVIVFADDSHLVEPSDADLDLKVAELSPAPDGTRINDARTDAEGRGVEDTGTSGVSVIDNADANRFELMIDGELKSFATYSDRQGALVVPHVETLHRFRGNGHAEQLMDGVVENLRNTGRTIVPLCPYAARYLRDRPATHDLLAP